MDRRLICFLCMVLCLVAINVQAQCPGGRCPSSYYYQPVVPVVQQPTPALGVAAPLPASTLVLPVTADVPKLQPTEMPPQLAMLGKPVKTTPAVPVPAAPEGKEVAATAAIPAQCVTCPNQAYCYPTTATTYHQEPTGPIRRTGRWIFHRRR